VEAQRWSLAEKLARLKGLSPHALVRNARQRLDDLSARATTALTHRLKLEGERVNRLTQALNNVGPLVVLSRGYAIVSDAQGDIVRSASQVKTGDPLKVRVSEGEFGARVE
jgi:exodeoxyribonuclease VII large subunit